MAQYGLPIGDTGTTYLVWPEGAGDGDNDTWDEIDEGFGAGRGTGSGPDDELSYRFGGSAGSTLVGNLNSLTDPSSSTGHIVRQRVIKTDGSGVPSSSGKQIDTYPGLSQSSVVIAEGTQTTILATWTTHTYTLTSGEADSITDYTVLRTRSTSVPVGGGSTRFLGVSAQELEIPDAGAPGGIVCNPIPLQHFLVR